MICPKSSPLLNLSWAKAPFTVPQPSTLTAPELLIFAEIIHFGRT